MTRTRAGLVLLLLLAGVLGATTTLGVVRLTEDEHEAPAASTRSPGAVDIGFAQDMAVHHEQALVMAQLATGRTVTDGLAPYVRQILVGQAQEQGMLRGWLTLWQAPQLPSGPPMTWMGHEHRHGGPTTMPGMATQAELDRLARKQGNAFDAELLRLMTRHHGGGVEMAAYAAEHAELPEVRSLAALMARSQQEEITAFRRLAEVSAPRSR